MPLGRWLACWTFGEKEGRAQDAGLVKDPVERLERHLMFGWKRTERVSFQGSLHTSSAMVKDVGYEGDRGKKGMNVTRWRVRKRRRNLRRKKALWWGAWSLRPDRA